MNKIQIRKSAAPYFFFIVTILTVVCCSCSSKQNERAAKTTMAPADQTNQQIPVQRENFERGKILPKVQCVSASQFSFALYIPDSANNPSRKFPVIIFLDPHGSGEYVVKKYQHLAEEFNVILIGSNDSKNGLSFDETNTIVNTLISEAVNRLNVEKDITLAGFSGGARVALSSAMSNQDISSVIYCGAAMPIQKGARIFSVLGFAGTSDMNYTDVVSFDQSLQNSSYNHFLIEWNGKHEWPDSITFRNAFYWITFNRLRSGEKVITSGVKNFLEEYHRTSKNKRDDVQQEETEEKMIYFLNGIQNVDEFRTNATAIQKSTVYQEELALKQKTLAQESAMKQQYIDDFQSKDLSWWKNETARMNAVKDPSQKPMYQRLLGFISLAGYSISNNAIQQNNFPQAEKMLAIYKLADPKNSDQAFLEACLLAKQGRNPEAIQSIQRAVDLGLNDPAKLLSEPALVPLQQDEKFKAIISKMKSQ